MLWPFKLRLFNQILFGEMKMLKRKIVPMLAMAAVATLSSCSSTPSNNLASGNQKEQASNLPANLDIKKISEALGNFIGKNLNSPGMHFDVESLIKGIRAGAEGKPSPMDEKEYEQAMHQLQEHALNSVSAKNLEDANAFLKDNVKASGVIELIPGKLQYAVIQEGKGPAVQEGGNPQINYTGKYINGTVFGSSESSGGPITVPLDQTIPGFAKGIAGMKEGEKRRLFVHPDIGYGTTGQLPPNSLLIFDVEVVKASTPEAEAPAGKTNTPEPVKKDATDTKASVQQTGK